MKKAYSFLLLIILIMFFTSCNQPYEEPPLEFGFFNIRHDIEGTTAVNSAQALDEDKTAAMNYLLNLVINNTSEIERAARLSNAQGNMVAGNMGQVNLVGTSLFVVNPDSWYHQSVVKFNESQPEVILPTLQAMLDKASRHYYNGNKVRIQEVGNKGEICMREAFPYTTCDFNKGKEYTLELSETTDYLTEFRALSNFIINESTVNADTLSIIYSDDGYYTLSLELDLSTQEKRDISTDKPRQMMREMSKMPNLEYTKVAFTIEIWDTGLIKSLETVEAWEGIFRIFSVNLTITSSITTNNYYSYNPIDSDYENLNIDLSWV